MKAMSKKKVWVGYVPSKEHSKYLFYWSDEDNFYKSSFLSLVGGVCKRKIKDCPMKIRITVEDLSKEKK